MSLLPHRCQKHDKPEPCMVCFDEIPEHIKIADEVTNIRNRLWQITDEMVMTRAQMHDIENIKNRLWTVQERLREIKK